MSDIELKNCRCMCGCVCAPKNGDDNTRIDYHRVIEKIEACVSVEGYPTRMVGLDDVISILKEAGE